MTTRSRTILLLLLSGALIAAGCIFTAEILAAPLSIGEEALISCSSR